MVQTLEIECNNKDSITTKLSSCSCSNTNTKYKYYHKGGNYYYFVLGTFYFFNSEGV